MAVTDHTRPFLVLYVVWHPAYKQGEKTARALFEHFRRELYENVAGGTGLSVIFRSAPAFGGPVPPPIDLSEGETTAIVVLVESNLVGDANWGAYIRDLIEKTEAAGLSARFFPVAIDDSAFSLKLEEQALRWDQWKGRLSARHLQLISELAYEFCRMLRHYNERLRRPQEDEALLERYLKKVQIFLSHSKHDEHGERVARAIRDRIHSGRGLAAFFDVHDIPAGLRFSNVLLQQVKASAVIAVHTDSYSSREWCRREIIQAKRWNVPLVVANCIEDLDERGFPYLGNVPIVRLDPRTHVRIDAVIGRLLDEVLKDFLWRCRTQLLREGADQNTIFVSRPPELITLASLPKPADVPEPTIVYPDPPLSAEEEQLFDLIAPRVRLRSFTEWLATIPR